MRGWARLRAARQSRLLGAMMERLGIDPAAAAARGRAFEAATRRCLWCAASRRCGQWLETAGARDRAPAFCPDAAFLDETGPKPWSTGTESWKKSGDDASAFRGRSRLDDPA